MVSTFTTNKGLEKPGRGDQSGSWDTPVNNNSGIIDLSFGGVATILLTNSPVTLSSGQYQCVFLKFSGALTANVPITLPSIGSFYTVINNCTNSSAYYLTAQTTATGGHAIGLPPGAVTDIMTDGTHTRFRGQPSVGTYWDYAGSSVPAWISACTVPPWLYCNGGTFSSATYPYLATHLGTTTLPDFRGRFSYYLNDGSSRITSSSAGLDGNTIFATGGNQTVTLSSQNLPNTSFPVTDPGHSHTNTNNINTGTVAGVQSGAGLMGSVAVATVTINSTTTGVTVNSGGSGTPVSLLPPTAIGGIRLIRAA